jgi:phage gp36-like protein
MFLTTEDYRPVCGEEELDVLQQSETQIREQAERTAIEEISSYLRARYDVEAAFAATGSDRNPMLVQVAVNIALYHLVHWLPMHLASEGRHELYERDIEWLSKVAKGTVQPDLPTYTDENGNTDTGNPVKFGTMPKQQYDW